jgi:anti-repressor protein
MWFLTENGVLELLTKSRKLKAKQLKLTIEEVLKDIRDKAKTALNEGFQAFYNSEFGEIRMAVIDGKPYAVGIDVAKVLEYAKPEKAISDHCGYPLKWGVTDSLGRTRSTMMISEGDIYRLIIAAANQSLNPEIKVKAKEFEKWVFDEVLPEIRKNGYYMTNAKVAEVTSNPDAFIKELEDKNAKLVADLEAERAENRQLIEDNEYLQLAIEENEYKVTFADAVAVSEGCMLIREAAKVLNNNDIDIGPNQLSEILRNKSLLIRKKGSDYNTPTRKAMKLGLFKLKLSTVNGELKRTPYLTPKGLIYVTNNLYDWSKWSNES